MDLVEYLTALRKRWALILALMLIGGVAGFGYAKAQTPIYRATSKVFVSVESGDTVGDLVQGSTYIHNLVQSYSQLATTPAVLDPVTEELGLPTSGRELAHHVSAQSPLDTVIIEISATNADPQRAADIANAVAGQLSETVEELTPTTSKQRSAVDIQTISPASVPGAPASPNTKFLTATGLALGLLLGVLIAVLIRLLDTRIRDRRDLAQVSDAPLLGVVPRWRGSRRRAQVAMTRDPGGRRAEAYRSVRSNLEFVATTDGASALVITSARQGQGKTTTAVNLALALAEQKKRIVLVDADLRRPALAEIGQLDGSRGLTTVLVGRASIDDVVQRWGSSSLDVITSGLVPPNPLQLVDSQGMFDFLRELRLRYDVVVLDSPPLLAVADATVLSKHVDGAIVTASSGRTRRPELGRALDALAVARANVIGIILTRARTGRHDKAYRSHASTRRQSDRTSSAPTSKAVSRSEDPAVVGQRPGR